MNKKDKEGGGGGGGEKKNTAIYVTDLPIDVTLDELNEHFSKVGVIMDDMWTGGPRIKIYENEEGVPKGDALVVYLRPESVKLAIDILDESQLRPGKVIHVQAASFSQQQQQPQQQQQQMVVAKDSIESSNNTNNAITTAKVDKATWKKRMRQMQRKLAWGETDEASSEDGLSSNTDDDDDDESQSDSDPEGGGQGRRKRRAKMKQKRILVIRNMYEPEEIAQDPAFLLELREDLYEECTSRIGPVTSIHILDHLGDEGICTVAFTTTQHARMGVQLMEGRFFAGRQLRASLYDGSFRLRERRAGGGGSNHNHDHDNSQDDEAARIDKFGAWLEAQSSSGGDEDDGKDLE